MRLISLNIWGGRVYAPLLNLLNEKKDEADIFCFQEVFKDCKEEQIQWFIYKDDAKVNIYKDISNILSEYTGYFTPVYDSIYGIATFVKNNLKVQSIVEDMIYEEKNFPDLNRPLTDHSRKMQTLNIEGEISFNVCNLHGHWVSGTKDDNEDRIRQSNTIIERLNVINFPTILCGDFNLLPSTKSIAMIEEIGMKNLIKEFSITSTRTSLYKKNGDKFADYTFVNNKVKVNDFKILPDEVSDHSPMFIDFE